MSLSAPPPFVWLMLAALGVIWGSSFMSVELALTGLTPLQIAAIRIDAAAVILTGYALVTGRERPRGRRTWLHVLGFALFSNAFPFSLLAWGQTHVASGFAGVSMACVPLLVLPLAHFLVPGERMTPLKGLGFLAGFAGTLILIGPGAFVRSGASLEDLARLACVAAAGCYACGAIVTRLAPPASMVGYSAATLVVAATLITPYMLWADGLPAASGPVAWGAVLYLGILPTAGATLMMVSIIRIAGPSFLSLVNYQVPVWSVIFGATLLSEPLPPSLLLALGLILGGLAISQAAARRR